MDQHFLLTIDQAAERLNVTSRFIRRLIAERRIDYLKIGKFIRFRSDELDDWVEQQRIEQLDGEAS
jgi:excisionase family DNA binding protein